MPPDLIARFRADLARVWPESGGGGRFGVAVSGGADSLALLLLAHAVMPGRVVAATVDHGLRAESAGEAALVAALCAARGVPHDTLPVRLEPGNVQDRARHSRYAALTAAFAARGAAVFATAHQADDQAETVLMRLARGSGLAGLAGIRARRIIGDAGESLLVRPLLGWRRTELAAVVADAGIAAVADPSNDDDRFDRVRMRAALTALPDLDPRAVARSAAWLQDAEDAVAAQVGEVIARHVTRDGAAVKFASGWPRLVEIEVVRHIVRGFGGEPSRSDVARMIDRLRLYGHATLGPVMARRARHRDETHRWAEVWRFTPAPQHAGT